MATALIKDIRRIALFSVLCFFCHCFASEPTTFTFTSAEELNKAIPILNQLPKGSKVRIRVGEVQSRKLTFENANNPTQQKMEATNADSQSKSNDNQIEVNCPEIFDKLYTDTFKKFVEKRTHLSLLKLALSYEKYNQLPPESDLKSKIKDIHKEIEQELTEEQLTQMENFISYISKQDNTQNPVYSAELIELLNKTLAKENANFSFNSNDHFLLKNLLIQDTPFFNKLVTSFKEILQTRKLKSKDELVQTLTDYQKNITNDPKELAKIFQDLWKETINNSPEYKICTEQEDTKNLFCEQLLHLNNFNGQDEIENIYNYMADFYGAEEKKKLFKEKSLLLDNLNLDFEPVLKSLDEEVAVENEDEVDTTNEEIDVELTLDKEKSGPLDNQSSLCKVKVEFASAELELGGNINLVWQMTEDPAEESETPSDANATSEEDYQSILADDPNNDEVLLCEDNQLSCELPRNLESDYTVWAVLKHDDKVLKKVSCTISQAESNYFTHPNFSPVNRQAPQFIPMKGRTSPRIYPGIL